MVKNLPCNARDVGPNPGRRTDPHAVEPLSPRARTRESTCCSERPCMPQLRPNTAKLINLKSCVTLSKLVILSQLSFLTWKKDIMASLFLCCIKDGL